MHQHPCEVWVTRLSELRPHTQALASVLTPAERADAAGHTDTTTGTLSRAVLRLVLGRYLGLPAAQLEIDRRCPTCDRPHGRPRLRAVAGSGGAPEISVSHGGDLLVVAFTGQGRVGVDVEADRSGDTVADDLVELALTVEERRHLAAAPPDQRRRLFLHHWTAKEAVLKALGTGLDVPLQAVTLRAVTPPAPPGAGTAEVTVAGAAPAGFAVRYLDVGPAHVCALATTAPPGDVPVSWLSPSVLLDLTRR